MTKIQATLLAIVLCANSYGQPQVALTSFATGFDRPIDIAHTSDDRLFIVEQAGEISIVQPSGAVNSTLFLDIKTIVSDGSSEQGLLGLAFHPNLEVGLL